MSLLTKVWEWLKKWWFIPVGVMLLALVRLVWKGKPIILTPVVDDSEKARRLAKEEADKQAELARAKRDADLKKLEAERAEVFQKMTDEQKDEAIKLLDDPYALNSYLVDVGEKIRS